MKKLLLITLIIPFISLAQEKESAPEWFEDAKDFYCYKMASQTSQMWTQGKLLNCEAGDTLMVTETILATNILTGLSGMIGICKEGTIEVLRDSYVDNFPDWAATCELLPISKWKALRR